MPGGTMPDTKRDLDEVGWVGASARDGVVVKAGRAAGESGGSGEGKRDLDRIERPCWRWMMSEAWRFFDVYPPRWLWFWSSGWGWAGFLGS